MIYLAPLSTSQNAGANVRGPPQLEQCGRRRHCTEHQRATRRTRTPQPGLNPPPCPSTGSWLVCTRTLQENVDPNLRYYFAYCYHRGAFVGAVRTKTTLPSCILETAISRVAALTRTDTEYKAHTRFLREANPPGLVDILEYLPKLPNADAPLAVPASIDQRHAAVLTYTDAVTLNIDVPDSVFGLLREAGFQHRELVELTLAISCYNFVCRYISALRIPEPKL